jgi:hypothetical protein
MTNLTIGTCVLVILLGSSPDNQPPTIKSLEQRVKFLEDSNRAELEQRKEMLGRIAALEDRVAQYGVADVQRQEKLEDCVKKADQAFYNFQTSRGTPGADGKLYVDAETMKDANEFWRGRLEVCRTLYGRGLEVVSPTR